MTLDEAEEALRKVYERHAMALLKRDRLYRSFNGVDMLPRPGSLRQCVEAIEELTQKTVVLEMENQDATPERLANRVKVSLDRLGL